MINACCKADHEGSAAPTASPFSRALVTDYYDGAKEGVVECGRCHTVYAFRMLAWDDSQNVRVYSLADLDSSFETVAEELLGRPAWGATFTIVPPFLSSADSDRLRLTSAPPSRLVASEDILSTIIANIPYDQVYLRHPPDWFALLSLSR